MNSRENMIAAIYGKAHEWVPDAMCEMAVAGSMSETFENGPFGGGKDSFGVIWKPSASAGGQGCPVTSSPVLEDIARWREVVKFPDLEDFDWQGLADRAAGRRRPDAARHRISKLECSVSSSYSSHGF